MLSHNIGFWLNVSLLLTASSAKKRTKSGINHLVYILVPCTCAENWRNDTFTHKDFMYIYQLINVRFRSLFTEDAVSNSETFNQKPILCNNI